MAEKRAAQQPVIKQKPTPTEDDIRKRAYEIYCARSGSPGSEVDDWLKAETELKEGHATAG
ncbi:MAG: DUF2934 domain-containing protein [Candidatus Binataceae bacterium]|jgi:hypothetical protein